MNATHSITISDFTKKAVEAKFRIDPSKISLIYPVVPTSLLENSKDNDKKALEEIKSKYRIAPDTFIIIAVARLVKRKGTEYAIRAVAEMKDTNVKLFIIGDGPERKNLEELIRNLKVSDQVIILGKVKDIIPYYKIAHVALLVSFAIGTDGDFEGLGLVLLEAQSYGIPVIGTKSGGIPEAFEDGTTGICIPPENVKALVDALRVIKNDQTLGKRFTKDIPAFLEQRFGIQNTVDRYLHLFENI